MNLDMQERAVAMLRSTLGMDSNGKAPGEPCGERRDGGFAGLDTRLEIVTMQVQDEGLVGSPAQFDAFALGCAQDTLRLRHAAVRDAKLEGAVGGLRAFVAGHDG